MHRIPISIKGHQRASQCLKAIDAKKLIKQKLQELKNADGCIKKMRTNQLSSVTQGTQRGYFHTLGRKSMAAFTGPYEPWSDDMACVLQGTCMPGSTRYCRTNSMFGKMNIADIQQGSGQYNIFSSGVGSIRRFHTTSRPVPSYNIQSLRDFTTSTSGLQNCESSRKLELWEEDIACILQGTCLPGSTRYCRTNSMFGKLQLSDIQQDVPRRYYSTGAPNEGGQVSQKERLKRAVRDYGSTVIVFHVCISLISLGSFYLAVSSGIDMQSLLSKVGFSQALLESKFATGTSTFLMSYAVHKLFAPVRIGITLTCTPLIVRYLRGIGMLKKSTPK